MITKAGVSLAAKLTRWFTPMRPQAAIQDLCSRICRHAATLQRLAETACNRELTEREEAADKRAEMRVALLVESLRENFGLKHLVRADFNGDPRGAVVKIMVSDQSGDWFGGNDYVVVL